mmetsp:Transcript_13172/g.34478  ORF Transcript_13172/g.34478 Transcript_13172/m.34478 type:complete len:222 (-) Transcript_13172:281-946(-)
MCYFRALFHLSQPGPFPPSPPNYPSFTTHTRLAGAKLSGVNHDRATSHRCRQCNCLDVRVFDALGAHGVESLHEGSYVLLKGVITCVYTANRCMNDTSLFYTEKHLRSRHFLGNKLADIRSYRAHFGVGHQSSGPQDTSNARHNRHHVGGGNATVKSDLTILNLLYQIFSTHKGSTSFKSFLGLVISSEDSYYCFLSSAMGEFSTTAYDLVSFSGIDVQMN